MEKQRHEGSQKREDKRWIRSEKGKVRREKMEVLEKIWTSRNYLSQWFVAPQVSISEMKHCTSLWHEAYVQVSMIKTPHARSTFGCWHVEKVRGVVVRSTFWRAKCIHHAWTTFRSSDVEEVHAVAARDTCLSQSVQNTTWREAHLRRETQKVHQSEGRQGEDAKEGAAHIVALFAWCGCWFILSVTESTLCTRLLDTLVDCLLGWLSAHIQAMGLWLFHVISMLHVFTSMRAKRRQHFQKNWASSQAVMHLSFIRRQKQRQRRSDKQTCKTILYL